MRRALVQQEFELYYQPKVDMSDGSVTGFEALVRWHHPRRGLLQPEDFIPLAEETGLVAARYTSLGVVHGAAFLTGRAHLFLAEELTESKRSPETYEQDMEVLRLPFGEALHAALEGQIVHSGSVTALCRAARALKLL